MSLIRDDVFHRMELRLDFPDGQMWHCPTCQRSIEVDAGGSVRVLFQGDIRAAHVRDERDRTRARRLQPNPIEQEPLERRTDEHVDRGEHSDAESWGYGGPADVEWLKEFGIAW